METTTNKIAKMGSFPSHNAMAVVTWDPIKKIDPQSKSFVKKQDLEVRKQTA